MSSVTLRALASTAWRVANFLGTARSTSAEPATSRNFSSTCLSFLPGGGVSPARDGSARQSSSRDAVRMRRPPRESCPEPSSPYPDDDRTTKDLPDLVDQGEARHNRLCECVRVGPVIRADCPAGGTVH